MKALPALLWRFGALSMHCTAASRRNSRRSLNGLPPSSPFAGGQARRLPGGEIVRESGIMMLLGTMSAEQRLAAFLLNLSQRMKARGYSPSEFYLRMTREEMGSYLGMKLETVSRMFSKFQKEGIVDTRGKQIRIVDFERLARV
jgi:CRP/FNR family transcriptional regulator, anaerobic regulatory protein